MATSDFQPQRIDTDWRVVTHWDDEAGQTSRANVSCFEFYGEALAAWMQIDREQGSLIPPAKKLSGWELIDPNGFELLTRDVRLIPDASHLGNAEPGLYLWHDELDNYKPL